jgi:transketolase
MTEKINPCLEKKATRDGFGAAIEEIGKNKDIVVLDADLSESTRSIKFKEKYPERFFDMGIAEQDMVATAAGLAASGKIPFACSFAIFITGNAYQQIRLHAGISKLNIKLIGSHAGLLTGEDGASHQSLEDISMMRAIPGMVVVQPSDYIEAAAATKEIAKYKGPVYLRLGRGKLPLIHDANYKFEIGKADILKKGKDISIFATGSLVAEALNAAEKLKGKGIDAEIISIHTIKPIDKKAIIGSVKKTGKVLTCEDHNIIGGLGTVVEEVLSENLPCFVTKIGVNDTFGESGKPEELYKKYGLAVDNIVNVTLKVVKGKS